MFRRLGPAAVAALTPLPVLAPAALAPPVPTAQTVPVTQAVPADPLPDVPAGTALPVLHRTTGLVKVAHRGASAHAPENTLAAFRQARAMGADVFELDVRQTKDGRLILMHDTTLARTTDAERVFPARRPWRVRDFTLAEIRRLDAGSWWGPAHRGERVPTLREALRAMGDGPMGVLIEVKPPAGQPGVARRVATELRAGPTWLGTGRTVVQSFDRAFVRSFHRIAPDVPTAVLGNPTPAELPGIRRYARYVNPPHRNLTPAYVASAHRHGLRVYAWTVDDVATMRRLAAADVDGIVTNRPDLLWQATDPGLLA
ncbi:glycerophosphodiester phosphodiesterase [Actinomadura craniellae]|uniref:Glycerophosphodiester phosphodiesterase n=1 Tax=Actinomadura craniellae TaxID=2231787 RepID=A0A365HBD3_9ACTN|nr:glycerophosphodiester phosphodiesterase family protein [Actinomadura craniellae]RAY16450.1 glycerophosphodiester phosphodiesterase [Actinomadura craniellae]